jgi:hypothetical protein
MQTSHVRPYQKWNWAGDEIVHDSTIPASRTLPGGKRKRYPIDIREFLSIEDNAVIRKHMELLKDELTSATRDRFISRRPGSFDLRLSKVAAYMSRFRYQLSKRRFDQWLFPEETLALQGGDCEDLAFLLAALLEASDISPYCIRVALGTVCNHISSEKTESWDHAWVVCQNESGAWEIVEPVACIRQSRILRPPKTSQQRSLLSQHPDVEYIPHFVFNKDHLWRVNTPDGMAASSFSDYVTNRKDAEYWQKYKPSFAAKVHSSIFDDALKGMPEEDLDAVKRASLRVDVNVLRYDPRDHFDFAYIAEAWERVNQRLSTGKLDDFALAVHAIGDFYAHSFYAAFAPARSDGSIEPFDPAHPLPAEKLIYNLHPYAPLPGCESSPEQAADHWKGELISGQWWRWYSTFPDDLQNSPGFSWRRCLPDHDRVAVDGPNERPDQGNYQGKEYCRQFNIRRQASVEHIQNTYSSWLARKH